MDLRPLAGQERAAVGWTGADHAGAADDFILWVTLGIIVGGRTGYVLFYNPAFFVQHPAEIFQLWNGGMSFHGGFLGCVAAVMLFARKNDIRSCRSATSPPRSDRSDCSSAGSPTSSTASCGVERRIKRAMGDGVSQWRAVARHPSQLYEAGLEGILLFAILAVMVRMGALKRPGLILGSFIAIYGLARITAEFSANPIPSSDFCGAD